MADNQEYQSPDIATERHRKPASKAGKFVLAAVIVVLVAGSVLLYRHNHAQVQAKASEKFASKDRPIPVLIAQAVQRDIDIYLDALGTVTPRNTVMVKSRVDGQLEKLYFREGQMIKSGELLAQIDPRPFEATLAQASGQLARDKALLENAQTDLERYKTLLAQDSISRQQVDTQESLVRQYRGAIAVDQAQVESAKLQLTYTRITAPISGRVGLRQVDPGNMIHSADANGIVTITQLQPITVLYSIPEDNLPAVLQRVKAGVSLPVLALDRAQKTKLASGTLLTADNQIDPATGTIKLRAEFKNDEGVLFPNQFVNIRMLVNAQENATVVPVSALQRGRNGDYVYVVVNNATVAMRPVTAGHVDGEFISIDGGLKVGEAVVIDGVDKLRDGAKVKPRTANAANEPESSGNTTGNQRGPGAGGKGAWRHKGAA